MIYTGNTVREAVGKAINGDKQVSRAPDDCEEIINETVNIERDLKQLANEVRQIENALRRNERESIEAGVDVAEAIVSIVAPMAGRAIKGLRIIAAVRRALKGGRSQQILQELRDLFDILSEIREGVEGIGELSRMIPEWAELRNRLSLAQLALDQAARRATALQDRYLRSRCYRHHLQRELNQSTRGDGFLGV